MVISDLMFGDLVLEITICNVRCVGAGGGVGDAGGGDEAGLEASELCCL